jgi:hypothetical protein
MLDIRPIVVNDEMIVLGGNMRLKACIEAGLKEVSIIKASDLTPEQQNEFIIKDNVGFGEWNWDDLANDWDSEQLTEWGLDVWQQAPDIDYSILNEEDVKDRNFVASIKMMPDDVQVATLQAMMNNAVASNPQLVIYLDPFKAMRMAKENVELGELYFRQAQKRFIKTEQEKAMVNSQQNAEAQQASIQAKMQADSSLEQQKALMKEKEIILQGVFDLAKANIPVPQELQALVSSMLQNVSVPIDVQNQQQQAQ